MVRLKIYTKKYAFLSSVNSFISFQKVVWFLSRFSVAVCFQMKMAHKLFVACIVLACIISEGKRENKLLPQQDDKDASLKMCKEGSYVLNECEERCECKNGNLINCYRVRKEFTRMDIEERKRFIKTYQTASEDPAFKQDYEKMVALHINAPDYLLHHTPDIFFPWHRWFLVQFENLLRRIDCRVTVPYWDWSRVAHHWWRGSGNEDLWNPGEHGLGGDGDLKNHCVEDGPFRNDKWRLLNISRGGCLRRYFWYVSLTGDMEHVNRTLSLPLKDFFEFEKIVRAIYHAEIHDFIGGTMLNSKTSSNAPEMVLHHSFLDKLWLEWQKKGEEYKNVFFPELGRFKLPESKYYGWEWMDSSNMPGQVKVLYQD